MKSTPATNNVSTATTVPNIVIDKAQITWRSMTRQEVPTLAKVEQEHILQTLKIARGNRTHAANILGISLRTLRNKIRQYRDQGVFIAPNRAGRVSNKERALLEGKTTV
jgi:DNA-binding NtrC family response regulator